MAYRTHDHKQRGLICHLLFIVVSTLFVTSTLAAAATPPPDCQCRAPDGERQDLGTVTCVRIGSKPYLVRCEMSTNTPYWRRLHDEAGCALPAA